MATYNDATGVWQVEAWAVKTLEEKVAKFNRKAAKMKQSPIVVERLKEWRKPVYMYDPFSGEQKVKYYVEMADVKVTGETPKIPGWTLLARIEHLRTKKNGAGKNSQTNLVRRVPGTDNIPIPKKYWRRQICDHCKSKRRRNDTFLVVREKDGKMFQVGRQCVADYLGHKSVDSIVRWIDSLLQITGSMENWDNDPCCPRDRFTILTEPYLAYVSAVIRKKGWRSRTEAKNNCEFGGCQSTADEALYQYVPPVKIPADKISPDEKDWETAKAALKWAKAIKLSDTNDYLRNLQTIATLDGLAWDMIGYAASIIPAYNREQEREVQRKHAAKGKSKHQGEVGKRQVFKGLTVVGVRKIEGYYGLTTILNFRDAKDNEFTWFASGSRDDVDLDEVYDVKGTVKRHGEYRNKAVTFLSRCSLSPVEEVARK